MGDLQNALEEIVREAPYQLATDLVMSRIAPHGVKLTARERERLLNHLKAGLDDPFSLRRWRWWEKQEAEIELTEADAEMIYDRFTEFVDNQLPGVIDSVLEKLSATTLRTLNRSWQKEFRRQARERRGFEKRLQERWGTAISRLRMMITISREIGEMTCNAISDDPDFEAVDLVEVLTRLHARACQVSEEIVCLLSSGFADGAMARWRTLHEIAVVSMFIQGHGEDLARRYIDHDVVESFRAADEYCKYSDRLGYEPMNELEFNQIRQARDEVVQRYGKAFKGQYGWAAEVLRRGKPTLKDIEEAAGVDHLRPYYRLASHNVHPNPKGVFFKLGLLPDSTVLLAGASNAGLADPGHDTAISLSNVSIAQVMIQPSLDSLVGVRILLRLTDEVGDLFIRAHQKLEEEAG